MKYRITIDVEEFNQQYPDRTSWNEIYQQIVEDLNPTELVSIINRPVGARRYPTAEEFWNHIEKRNEV